MEFLKDLKYGEHERNSLDITFPDELKPEMGLVMVIHGGGFIHGDKSEHTDDIFKIAEKGAVAASMNYRYASKDASLFDIIKDITDAVKFVKEKCNEKNIALSGMMTYGGSAGGHLSLYYAYTMNDKSPVPVKSVVALCPPADMASEEIRDVYYYNGILGDGTPEFIFEFTSNLCKYSVTGKNIDDSETQEKLKSISPLYFIDNTSVPTALIHGDCDRFVPYANSVRLNDALEKSGVAHEFVTIFGADHGPWILENEMFLKERERLLDKYIKTYIV